MDWRLGWVSFCHTALSHVTLSGRFQCNVSMRLQLPIKGALFFFLLSAGIFERRFIAKMARIALEGC